MILMNRRKFLLGAGGSMLALPWLEAYAEDPGTKVLKKAQLLLRVLPELLQLLKQARQKALRLRRQAAQQEKQPRPRPARAIKAKNNPLTFIDDKSLVYSKLWLIFVVIRKKTVTGLKT